jgi:hypothetical protein
MVTCLTARNIHNFKFRQNIWFNCELSGRNRRRSHNLLNSVNEAFPMFITRCSDFDKVCYDRCRRTRKSIENFEFCKARSTGSRALLRAVYEFLPDLLFPILIF